MIKLLGTELRGSPAGFGEVNCCVVKGHVAGTRGWLLEALSKKAGSSSLHPEERNSDNNLSKGKRPQIPDETTAQLTA